MAESLKVVWNESLLTGVRIVDVQHKYLVDIINELAEAIETGKGASAIRDVLNLLKYYAEWHFGREEACMERYHCPVAPVNQQAHHYFLTTLEGFQVEFRQGGDVADLARRMYGELTHWLVSHIQKVDGKLAACAPAETS